MKPLTKEEIAKINHYVKQLGKNKSHEKTEIWSKFQQGDEVFIPFAKTLLVKMK